MRSRLSVLMLVASIPWLAWSCASSDSGNGNNPPGGDGQIFDPCVPNPQPGYDPSSLPGCCTGTGPAHCVPSSQILPALASQFMACDATSVCVPDPIIRAGGSYVPTSCTSSVKNSPGVCLSQCIPRVANDPQAALLGQDGCGDGELCVPCVNPLNGTSTGACSINALVCGTLDAGTDDAAPAMCPYTGPPIIDPTTLAACSPSCGGAHCLPASLVPAAQQSLLATCTANGGVAGFCTPDPLIESGGNSIPKSCTSVAGAEGRCLSTCLPEIAQEASLLPKDVCGTGELCAPCFNPTASDPTAPTGACTLACDKPAKPPVVLTCPWTGPPLVDPTTLPACSPACGGAHCIPSSLVPAAEQSLLATCPGGFCAPDDFIASGGKLKPKACTSVAGAEGRCLSTCLAAVGSLASELPQDVCASDEKCAPCFNPTAADPTAPTGACTIGCDAPTKPPVTLTCPWTGPPLIDPSTFPSCTSATCSNAHCVPASMIPASEQALLAGCTSTGGQAGFCTPDPIISTDNHWVPATCTSVAGAEGRCISTCLPSVSSKSAVLPKSTCGTNELCAPCYDPTSSTPNTPTGACSIGCDKPTQPPVVLSCPWTGPAVVDPSQLPDCSPSCGGAHCLPAAYVPAADQSLLATCPGGYCAPDPIIESGGDYKPDSCTAFAGTTAEGRCLSTCLPSVSSQASLEQSSCPSGDKCAPCYDPISGASTGACSTSSCDMPADPPYTFPNCCNYNGTAQGRCVPKSQVPSSEQGNLKQDVCSSNNYLCVPDENLPGGTGQGCHVSFTIVPPFNYDGSCISNCVNLGLGTIYPQANCPGNHTCIPCSSAPAGSPGC